VADDPSTRNPAVLNEGEITLGVLDAVHENGDVTQRTLSRELGIALGLTNAYLKRCMRKGLIKARTVPANRYFYYLTPKGFAEKSRLTAEYLSHSFHFYGRARDQMDECFRDCAERGWQRVVLFGAGELAEIALLCAMRHAVDLTAVVDSEAADGDFMGVPVHAGLASVNGFDAVLITDLKAPQDSFETVCAQVSAGNVLTLPLLRISRNTLGDGGA
jgi:DNA-binding MarR family transcriptional regulator